VSMESWSTLSEPGHLLRAKKMPEDGLIFDVGANNGDDTAAYLARGFRVIAVEANPFLCEDLHKWFANNINLGRAVVVNKAIDRWGGGIITLHLNSLDSAQGTTIESYSQRAVARGGHILNYDVRPSLFPR
jgi:FkbM family methyltransferase